MSDTVKNETIGTVPIDPRVVCEQAFGLMRDKRYDEAERLLANCLTKTEEPVALGLYHSSLGVLERLRGDGKAALRHYQRAEKLLPDDPALKLISARLLLEEFAEYDQAIRRCQKAIKLLPNNPVVLHHALTLKGLAYARRGDRRQAIKRLNRSIVNNFRGFVTTRNIDFHLVEWCVKKKWDLDVCRTFLERAWTFASSVHEKDWVDRLDRILQAM